MDIDDLANPALLVRLEWVEASRLQSYESDYASGEGMSSLMPIKRRSNDGFSR